jgi:putative sterol carrier protein
MSNDNVRQAPQQVSESESAASEIEAFFARVAAGGVQPRMRSVTGVCQFDIEGTGRWRVTINNGKPSVTQNPADQSSADCVVTATAEDFLRLMRREHYLNVSAALLQGLIQITGDLAFAMAVFGSYAAEPVSATSKGQR